MSSRRLNLVMPAAVLIAAAASWGGIASADVSTAVIKEFRGDLVITKGDLPEGKNDKDTIAKIKSERIKELTGEERGETFSWHFHYTAFLTKVGASSLKVQFFTTDKDKNIAADTRLEGVDPKSTVLSGDITITEDDGLSKGKSYLVKVVNDKNVVVASTPAAVMMK